MPNNITHFPPRLPIKEIGAAVAALIALLNQAAGDPDEENCDALGKHPDDEPDGDEQDAAWVEWDKMRNASNRGPNITGKHEDDEDDDRAEEDDPSDTGNAEDEGIAGELAHYATRNAGPGCMIADQDFGGEEAGEPEFGV